MSPSPSGYHAHFPLATYTLFNAISNFPANFSVAAVIAAVLILSTVPPDRPAVAGDAQAPVLRRPLGAHPRRRGDASSAPCPGRW